MNVDAVVIGAGPAGSAAAYRLASAGWSVAIVEKQRFPRRKVCGEFVSAATVRLLDSFGLGSAFRSTAGPEIRRIGLFARDAVLCADMPALAGQGDRWGRALGRETLDTLLLERALSAGAQLRQPYAAVDVRLERGRQRVTIAAARRGEEVLRAPVVIAAYGSWERGPFPPPRPSAHCDADLLAFKAHFRDAHLAPDLMPLVAFRGGYGGLARTDACRTTLSLCIRRDVLQQARQRLASGRAAAAVFEHVLWECEGVRAALRAARADGPWLSAGPMRPGIRSAYAYGAFFVGNAAGEAHPIIAEGISMAIQSADVLAAQLIAAESDVSLEDGRARVGALYVAEWRRRFASRVAAAEVFARLAARPRAGRVLLPLLRTWPGLLTFGGMLSGKAKPHGAGRQGYGDVPSGG